MNSISWVSLAGAMASMIVALIAIYNLSSTKRKAAVEEGKRQQEIFQMEKDLERAFEKIRSLEHGNHTTSNTLTEIQTTLRYIKETVDRLAIKLDKHCDERVEG